MVNDGHFAIISGYETDNSWLFTNIMSKI